MQSFRELFEKKDNLDVSDDAFIISQYTGLREPAVKKWIEETGINANKLTIDLIDGKINPMDVMTAISGNLNNSFAKKIIKKYT